MVGKNGEGWVNVVDDGVLENLSCWEDFGIMDEMVLMVLVFLILVKGDWCGEVNGKGWVKKCVGCVCEVCDIVDVVLSLDESVILSDSVDGVEIEGVFFFGWVWILNGIFFVILFSFFKIIFFFCFNLVVLLVVVWVVVKVCWNFEGSCFFVLFDVKFLVVDDFRVFDINGEFFCEDLWEFVFRWMVFEVFLGLLIFWNKEKWFKVYCWKWYFFCKFERLGEKGFFNMFFVLILFCIFINRMNVVLCFFCYVLLICDN